MSNWAAPVLIAAWEDLDRALEGVSEAEATRQVLQGSSFAWTLAHVTAGIESWLNVHFQSFEPDPLIMQERFRFGGTGAAADWREIREAVAGVRARALPYMLGLSEADLELTLPYYGSHSAFREHGIQLRAAILQNAVHHHYHVGEIVTKRELLGHEPGTFPGNITEQVRTNDRKS